MWQFIYPTIVLQSKHENTCIKAHSIKKVRIKCASLFIWLKRSEVARRSTEYLKARLGPPSYGDQNARGRN